MEQHICRKCGTPLTKENWKEYNEKNYIYLCQNCAHEYINNRRKIHERTDKHNHYKKDTQLRYSLNYWRTLKSEVMHHYSGDTIKCTKCGFEDMRALSVDHISGNGSQHRKEIKHMNIYLWLRKNNYPEGFQILCMNCQFIKRHENHEHKRNNRGLT